MKSISIFDISIVLSYLAICLILGFKRFGQIKTLRDYTFGDKPFSTIVLTATTFATIIGANKVIGNVGESYRSGITFAATMFVFPIGWFLMGRLLANNLSLFHQKKFLTLGDIMEHYYGKFGRKLTSLAAIIFTLGVTAGGSMAMGKLGYYFFGIPEFIGVLIALSVVTIYSTIGGFCAVAFTDVFQFVVFFIAIPVACAIGYHNVGGYKNILQALPPSHLTVEFKDLGFLLSIVALALMAAIDLPYIQRALVAQNKYQLQKIFNATGWLMVPLFMLIALIAFTAYAHNPNLQPNIVLYYFIGHYLPIGAVGLMIAGVLAIIMSSQDSYLNATSTLVARDIFKQIWPNLNAKQELLIARTSCVVLAILSVFLAFVKEDIPSLLWLVYNFWAPVVGVPFMLALAGIRIKKELFCIIPIVALTFQVIARQFVGKFDAKTATIGIVAATITTLIVSRMNRKQIV